MHGRPERPLLVKCTFDRWNKRISFASARNCSYDLLRNRVRSIVPCLLDAQHSMRRSSNVFPSMPLPMQSHTGMTMARSPISQQRRTLLKQFNTSKQARTIHRYRLQRLFFPGGALVVSVSLCESLSRWIMMGRA